MSIKLMSAGFEPGHAIAPIPHCNWNCPLKKRPRQQNFGKKLERKHTRRDLVQYRNCKLKQNVESAFDRTFKVNSKVTFQSRSTKHVRLMFNQAWWMHLAIFNMSHRKRVRTLESFFAPNRNQSESEKMIQNKNSVLIGKKRMRIEGNRKNHELSRKLGCKITRGCAMKRRRVYSASSGFSRPDATLRRERNHCEHPSASLIEPPSSAMDE